MSDVFDRYPNMKSYFETSDGEKFFTEDSARNYAKSLENTKVTEVERPIENGETILTAKEIIAKASSLDLDLVREFLDAENKSETPRKTVITALEKRISELESSDKVEDLSSKDSEAGNLENLED